MKQCSCPTTSSVTFSASWDLGLSSRSSAFITSMSTLFMSSNAVHSTISMKFLDWHHRISQQLSLSACPSPPASHQPTPRTGPAPPQGWYSCSPSSGRTARSTGANPTSSQQKSGYFLILPGMVQLSVSLDHSRG